MSESEWLACNDPSPMLEVLLGKASERKLRLYANACCRRVRHLLKDVRGAGLFGQAGLFLGSFGGADLRHDGPEHVMAFAPTRSGKGVGLVVPTLLSWTGSAVIHDIKGENWELTAGWRAKFSHCLLFDPTNPGSARFNPLLEVRKGPGEVRDVQNIVASDCHYSCPRSRVV